MPSVDPIARVLLAGALLPCASPYGLLSKCPDVVERIFVTYALDRWVVLLNEGNFTEDKSSFDALSRNRLPPSGQIPNICRVGHVQFPPPSGLNCNMLPFEANNETSIPVEYRGYLPLIRQCLTPTDGAIYLGPNIIYLTVHESRVPPNCSQRRKGIHTEGFLAKNYPNGGFDWWFWGQGAHSEHQIYGGIFHASTVSNSCRMWDVQIPREKRPLLKAGCDLDVLRGALNDNSRVFEPLKNELWWMQDNIPHESLPLREGTYRQFFRLVTGDVSVWWRQHSTANRLGIEPGCPIAEHSKFSPNALDRLDEHLGSAGL